MDLETLYLIDQKDGFSPEFGKLVSMMNFTRATTIQEVKDLTSEELDFLFNEEANSIGMLLAHMAAVEKAYQLLTFGNGEITDEALSQLNPGLELGEPARQTIKGHAIEHYLQQLESVRRQTLETFKTLPDEWLFEQTPFWGGHPGNNYFKWFHVFEDELNHRGQIRVIKKMMRSKSCCG
ncbi:DinB family protein [Camelliibacillus cellulosilyticus]|uniref:DinB family protein n=1 Tax=Camelliibacillus cellulosilyticus TaxID=2174486 RepID=A0ABV9GS81_9BACL